MAKETTIPTITISIFLFANKSEKVPAIKGSTHGENMLRIPAENIGTRTAKDNLPVGCSFPSVGVLFLGGYYILFFTKNSRPSGLRAPIARPFRTFSSFSTLKITIVGVPGTPTPIVSPFSFGV